MKRLGAMQPPPPMSAGVELHARMTLVDSCKIQSKCDVDVTDALNPANARGTLSSSATGTRR